MRYGLILFALVAAGCGSSASPTAPTPPSTAVASLAVDGNGSFTDRGQIAQFSATARLANGTMQDQTRAALWSSSNPAVATVSSTGLVTSVRTGAANITASFEGTSGQKTANVSIACEINNTARIRFGNRSSATVHDVVWDGAILFSLAPGQDSDYIVAVAGVPHSVGFLVSHTSRQACSTANPILPQCTDAILTCTGP